MQTRITLLVDHATGEVSIQGENLPDGQDAYFCLLRVLAASMNVVCDQLDDKRLILAKAFKPILKV